MRLKRTNWLHFIGSVVLLGLLVLPVYIFWWYPRYGFDYDEIEVVVTDSQSNPVVGAAIQFKYGVTMLVPSPKGGSATTDKHGIAFVRAARNVECESMSLFAKLPQYSSTDGHGYAGVDFNQTEFSSADKGSFKVSLQYLNGEQVPSSRGVISFRSNGHPHIR